ncbi:MAG TPA: hypothetical protein PKK60_01095 [archaeon]|nr:hypothetical protein [archaeon]
MKGQVTFELLFISLIVLSASIYITSLYFQTTENTNLIIFTKNEFIEKLNETTSTSYIESITLEKSNNLNKINLVILTEDPIETNKIINNVEFLTKFKQKMVENLKLNNVQLNITIRKI